MYEVSQAYINALKAPAKIRRLRGYVGSEAFTEDNIAQGSFNINNACSEGEDVKIGSVYMGELSCVFRGIDYTGQWQGKVITVSEGLLIGEDTWEDVPLGVFTVYEANHMDDGVHITAYDNMKLLDVAFPYDTTTEGQPWDFLQMIRVGCGITLAQTENEIKALPNGTGGFVLAFENDIETYRDMLFEIAQLLGVFATFDRYGHLELRKYGTESVYTIEQNERWQGASFSDFVTKYTGISLLITETGEEIYRGLEVDDGLTYNLGANPFIQSGNPDNVLDNILNALAVMQYTPFQVQRSGCPALDLGDVVTFPGGIGANKRGCVMSYDYTFHGQYEIQGFGSNPALSGIRSAEDKALTGAMRRANSNEIQFYTTTNTKDITINDVWKQIIRVRFGSMRATVVTFQAEIKLQATITDELKDAVIANIQYLYNNVEISYAPVETWIEGKHLLHLLYYFVVEGSAINELSVRMKCDGEILIKALDIQACLWGQGLAATSTWQGLIELEDNISAPIEIATTPSAIDYIGGEVEVTLIEKIVIECEDTVTPVEIDTVPVPEINFDGILYINKEPLRDLTWGDVKEYTWDEIHDGYAW